MTKKMAARIGDLAIAKFDHCSEVCIVTGRDGGDMEFIYSTGPGQVFSGCLPKGRLRAIPTKDHSSGHWNLCRLHFSTNKVTEEVSLVHNA